MCLPQLGGTNMSEGVGRQREYWAFISYSHRDARAGSSIHRRLENYVLPARLVGRVSRLGKVPHRLLPIFRDRDELPAATDLSAQVRAALRSSKSLIVVCSRASAASAWVSREVELFRELHPKRPILAAIIDGDPSDSFPSILRTDRLGRPTEPLAADFRPDRDGRELALLKLVAGITGVELDELVQRNAQRRTRRVMAVTVSAMLAVVVMAGLTAFAFSQRAEAVHQRQKAEELVEFMLTDLRAKLKGVGRLDIMKAVNQSALHYYADQNLNRLPTDSLERRARILHAIGEDAETSGDHSRASAEFREAARTTAALLAQEPADPSRLFLHAQSLFWFGYVAYERGQNREARAAWVEYRTLTSRAASIEPTNPKYVREVGYADGNLCSMMLKAPVNARRAVQLCGSALTEMTKAATLLHNTDGIEDDLVNRRAWLADAYAASGDLRRALAERRAEEALLSKQMRGDPKNMIHKADWVALQIALALIEEKSGQRRQADIRLRGASAVVTQMISFEPKNAQWREQANWLSRKLDEYRKGGTAASDDRTRLFSQKYRTSSGRRSRSSALPARSIHN